MNLKPFNLEEAIANPERVVTRDGRKVSQLTKFDVDHNFNVLAVIDKKLHTFLENGEALIGNKNNYDLLLLPQTKTVWVVVGTNCGNELQAFMFNDENGAKVFIQAKPASTYSKPKPIEIEKL